MLVVNIEDRDDVM